MPDKDKPKDNEVFGKVVQTPPEPEIKPEEEKKPEQPALEKFEDSPKFKEMSDNMKNMRGIIDTLNDKIKTGTKEEKKPEEKKPIIEVKFSRDLPKEQYEKMSEGERSMHDTIATMAQTINELRSSVETVSGSIKKVEENVQTPTERTAQEQALSLADGDIDKANSIIAKFNKFAGNDQLPADKFKERLEEAALLAGIKKTKKDAATIQGTAVQTTTTKDKDTSENDKIVDEVAKRRQSGGGSYSF